MYPRNEVQDDIVEVICMKIPQSSKINCNFDIKKFIANVEPISRSSSPLDPDFRFLRGFHLAPKIEEQKHRWLRTLCLLVKLILH